MGCGEERESAHQLKVRLIYHKINDKNCYELLEGKLWFLFILSKHMHLLMNWKRVQETQEKYKKEGKNKKNLSLAFDIKNKKKTKTFYLYS